MCLALRAAVAEATAELQTQLSECATRGILLGREWKNRAEEMREKLYAAKGEIKALADILLEERSQQWNNAARVHIAGARAKLAEAEHELKVRSAHRGDPCMYCGVGHDDVAVGICPATRDVLVQERDAARAALEYGREAWRKGGLRLADERDKALAALAAEREGCVQIAEMSWLASWEQKDSPIFPGDFQAFERMKETFLRLFSDAIREVKP
jgi:hypothetical protein